MSTPMMMAGWGSGLMCWGLVKTVVVWVAVEVEEEPPVVVGGAAATEPLLLLPPPLPLLELHVDAAVGLLRPRLALGIGHCRYSYRRFFHLMYSTYYTCIYFFNFVYY